MNRSSCDKEKEVLERLLRDDGPATAEGALLEHVTACPVCSDLILSVRHLQEEGRRAMAEAILPDAGLVWWKAQLRSRRDAANRATRPIAVVERLALICASICSVGVAVWKWQVIGAWVNRLGDLGSQMTFEWSRQFAPLLLSALGASIILVAFGLYFDWAEK